MRTIAAGHAADLPVGTVYRRVGLPASYKPLAEMTLEELSRAAVNFDLNRPGEEARLEAVSAEIRIRYEACLAALDDETWFRVVTRLRDPSGDDWWTRAVRHEAARAR